MPETFSQLRQLARLGVKVVQHIPEVPSRGRELTRNFFQQYDSIRTKVSSDIAKISEQIARSARIVSTIDDIKIFIPESIEGKKINLSTALFPAEVSLVYIPSISEDENRKEYSDEDLRRIDAVVMMTTVSYDFDLTRRLPTEGYKDSTGILKPFNERDKKSEVQHGGIFVSNSDIEILDYDTLREKKKLALNPGEHLIEANWYMDSENVNKVAHRDNLQFRQAYNTMGFLHYTDGTKRLFTINGSSSESKILKSDSSAKPDIRGQGSYPTVSEIAAMADYLQKQTRAKSWELVGLEFIGGGTYMHEHIPQAISGSRDFLLVEKTDKQKQKLHSVQERD